MPVTHVKQSSEFPTIISSAGKLCVADFTAKWCQPCRRISPVFDALSDTYLNVLFLKVDIDECPQIAEQYGVRSVPTFMFFKNGKEVDKTQGADPYTLEENIKKHGGTFGRGVTAFSGSGNRLGDSTSSSHVPSPGTNANTSTTGTGAQNLIEAAQNAMNVDREKPITKVNLRLTDGTRFNVTVNLCSPVSKLREFICIARPIENSRPFSFMTFPNKEIQISEESRTIEEANLANTVIMQKYT